MSTLETNIFPIDNLSELSTSYRLYEISGLRNHQPEYYQNRQTLIRKLSYSLKSPVTIIDLDNIPHLVLLDGVSPPQSPYPLVRHAVCFKPTGESYQLDYTLRNPENDEICLRFIQFMLQAPLFVNIKLWQPKAGEPFFEKKPVNKLGSIAHYQGCAVRAVITPNGGIGLCIDVKNKFVACEPLPIHLNKLNFKQYQGKHCIYHFGHQWYEIRVNELADQNSSDFIIIIDGEPISLIDYINKKSRKPIPEELANLPYDASVIHYFSNNEEDRTAPAGLCYLVYDTEEIGKLHQDTILPPHIRRQLIHDYRNRYLDQLNFGNTILRVASNPEKVEQKIISMPDYEFGNGHKLSLKDTKGAESVTLLNIGQKRDDLLKDKKIGFYVKERLDRQYLLLPESVKDSFGEQFIKDLKRIVNTIYPEGEGYEPIVISYKDRKPCTFLEQGKAILEVVEDNNLKPGYALVMIHHTMDRQSRQHDQLEAMVIRKLRKVDIYASVIHSQMGKDSYELVTNKNPYYQIKNHQKTRGKFLGYLRNVALNKILLTNERWPFILATPLNADITIGIDVKNNTAGFTIVGRHGSKIRTVCHTSKQKERLLDQQVKKYLVDLITEEAESSGEIIKSIVLHRDGRVYQSERDGAHQAIEYLKKQEVIDENATLTILEISKSSPAPFRLFDVINQEKEKPFVRNPQVGCFQIINNIEGYLCATGYPFNRKGTVNPLNIRFIEGAMPFEKCIEDVYYLTTLAWMRPNDCMRNPITIKLTDRRLGEDASEYDIDALQFELDEEFENDEVIEEIA